MLFVVMLLAGLSSTLDSGLAAASSLWVVDVANLKDDKKVIRSARFAMVNITLLGLLIAVAVKFIPQFGLQHLWWIFNTIAACVVMPTILSLYKNISKKEVFYGIIISFIVGVPFFVYASAVGNNVMIVASTLGIIAVSTVFCFLFKEKTQKNIGFTA